MSNTLKIQIPEGFKVASFDQATGTVNFEPIPKDIKERITNLNDVFAINGTNSVSFYEMRKHLPDDELAYAELKEIVKAYNEDKVPDYDDNSQVKYHPRFKLSSSGSGFSYYDYDDWFTDSAVGSRLDFLNYDNMKDAVNKFLPIYERWMKIVPSLSCSVDASSLGKENWSSANFMKSSDTNN